MNRIGPIGGPELARLSVSQRRFNPLMLDEPLGSRPGHAMPDGECGVTGRLNKISKPMVVSALSASQ
jgi:hypothetical protein